MNSEVDEQIIRNVPWSKLPESTRQVLGNSQVAYEKLVLQYSIKNQLRYRGNLVRKVHRDEKTYYDSLLEYSRTHLMLYPYHLSDFIVTQMRITPFQYYIQIMQDLIQQERSYDSLPNFTAADCLRLLGIGRNQYIELMNQCRSSRKFFTLKKKPVRDLLPAKPVETIQIEPWWLLQVGYVTENDVKALSPGEKVLIDTLIDSGQVKAGTQDAKDVRSLYLRGLVYLDVPIDDGDYICVPPLEGFVMNRVLGDYLETLLYKIFVSIDEHTTVGELAGVLEIDSALVKNAVSMYCRLGFALKKNRDEIELHPAWKDIPPRTPRSTSGVGSEAPPGGGGGGSSIDVDVFISVLQSENDLERDGWAVVGESPASMLDVTDDAHSDTSSQLDMSCTSSVSGGGRSRRIGFLFDSNLTAFLMMGNLSLGLKSHAVTMFEVGKLADESLDSFLNELKKVGETGEGEAQRYFEHASTLQDTVRFLRYNQRLQVNTNGSNNKNGGGPADDVMSAVSYGAALDLLRCESLQHLEADTCSRLLNKNYSLLISMAPLSNEVRPVTSCCPPHLGPAIPEVNSIWFKLYIYVLTGCGPETCLLSKGTRLRRLPFAFQHHDRLLITTWCHDAASVPTSNVLLTLSDALQHSATLLQAQGREECFYISFPFDEKDEVEKGNWLVEHPAVRKLYSELDLGHTCGYITLMNMAPKDSTTEEKSSMVVDELEGEQRAATPQNKGNMSDWVLLDCCFGLPLFDSKLNQEVCDRMVRFNLCADESLKHLTKSSRRLALRLLDFIAEQQVDNVAIESEQLPLPSQNLIFENGRLSVLTRA